MMPETHGTIDKEVPVEGHLLAPAQQGPSLYPVCTAQDKVAGGKGHHCVSTA